jgi:hypothetical protein
MLAIGSPCSLVGIRLEFSRFKASRNERPAGPNHLILGVRLMTLIPVLIEEGAESQPDTLGILSRATRIKEVDSETIRASLASLSRHLSEVFNDIKQVGEFKLKEIKLHAEISAEGGVLLLGTLKGGMKGAIELTFRYD